MLRGYVRSENLSEEGASVLQVKKMDRTVILYEFPKFFHFLISG